MSTFIVTLLLASANAFLLPSPRKPFRAAAPMMEDLTTSFDVAGFREYEECIVDAENAAEIAACSDMPITPKPAAGNDFMTTMSDFFNRFTPKSKLDIDVEECLVDAENAAEAAACRE